MKRKFIVLSNVIITFIIGLLGVGCCRVCGGEGEGMYMYGTPTAYHGVKGTVNGISNTEIVGIKVTIMDENNLYMVDSTQTDSSGKYAFNLNAFPQDTTKYTLSFKDIDGEKNGSYIDENTEVTILGSELRGREGAWNYGSVTKEVNVQLEAKKEDE